MYAQIWISLNSIMHENPFHFFIWKPQRPRRTYPNYSMSVTITSTVCVRNIFHSKKYLTTLQSKCMYECKDIVLYVKCTICLYNFQLKCNVSRFFSITTQVSKIIKNSHWFLSCRLINRHKFLSSFTANTRKNNDNNSGCIVNSHCFI
jgi:hypothetical protein